MDIDDRCNVPNHHIGTIETIVILEIALILEGAISIIAATIAVIDTIQEIATTEEIELRPEIVAVMIEDMTTGEFIFKNETTGIDLKAEIEIGVVTDSITTIVLMEETEVKREAEIDRDRIAETEALVTLR
jgi:Flp pilus assembly protein CpaB